LLLYHIQIISYIRFVESKYKLAGLTPRVGLNVVK